MIERDWSNPLGLELVEEPQQELPLYLRHFSGAGVETMADHDRLDFQFKEIKTLMKDGEWRSLQDIAQALKYPTASISAQLRNLRKFGYGSHTVNKKRRAGNMEGGTWLYQLVLNPKEAEAEHRRYYYAKNPKKFDLAI